MPLPEFTFDEQYLINSLKSPKATKNPSTYMWSYLVPCAVLAGVAAYNDNISVMLIAFVVLCGFRIYEENYQNRWLPLWHSIIKKFEDACNGIERDATILSDDDRASS